MADYMRIRCGGLSGLRTLRIKPCVGYMVHSKQFHIKLCTKKTFCFYSGLESDAPGIKEQKEMD